MRSRSDARTRPVRIVRFDPGSLDSADILGLVQMLGLDPGRTTYDVDDAPEGQVRRGPDRHAGLRFTTRLILEVMYLHSKTVAVPDAHVRDGLAFLTRNPDGTLFNQGMVTGDLFQVCVAKHRLKAVYVAVSYRRY
jgi:hypothetical protein